jgi:hypothetical protein
MFVEKFNPLDGTDIFLGEYGVLSSHAKSFYFSFEDSKLNIKFSLNELTIPDSFNGPGIRSS